MRATSFYLSLGMNKPLKNSPLMSSCPTAWESARRKLKTTETLNTLTEDVFPAVPCLAGSIVWIFSFFSFGCPSLVTLKDNEPRALQLKLKLLSKCCSPSADNRTCLLVKGTLKSLLGITLNIDTWEMSKVNKSGPSASVEKNACSHAPFQFLPAERAGDRPSTEERRRCTPRSWHGTWQPSQEPRKGTK